MNPVRSDLAAGRSARFTLLSRWPGFSPPRSLLRGRLAAVQMMGDHHETNVDNDLVAGRDRCRSVARCSPTSRCASPPSAAMSRRPARALPAARLAAPSAVPRSGAGGALLPGQAYRVAFADFRGVLYYTAEQQGLRVVATFEQEAGQAPIRMISMLAPTQSMRITVPDQPGVPLADVEVQRVGDLVVVREMRQTASNRPRPNRPSHRTRMRNEHPRWFRTAGQWRPAKGGPPSSCRAGQGAVAEHNRAPQGTGCDCGNSVPSCCRRQHAIPRNNGGPVRSLQWDRRTGEVNRPMRHGNSFDCPGPGPRPASNPAKAPPAMSGRKSPGPACSPI